MSEDNLVPKLRFSGFYEDWIEINIKDYSTIKGRIGWKNLKQSEYTESGPYLIAGKHITNGIINWSECDHLSMERYDESPEIALKSGDVIFSKDGSLGNPALIRELPDKATINGTMMLVRLYDKVTPNFFYQVLNSHSFSRLLHILKSGSSVPHIFQRDMENFKFKIPQSLTEQNQISNFLEVVDKKIELLKQKQKQYVNFKKYLMQQIFAQELRFKSDNNENFDDWEERKLSEFLTEHKLKSTGKEEVYSVSVHKGLVNQVEHLGRAFSAPDTSKYNLVKPGDIVYTKSPTGDFPLGIIKQSRVDKNVIVSPLYGVFSPETYDLGYILNDYFESTVNTHNYLHPIVQKGAKNTMNITNKTFLSKSLFVPTDKDEQHKIAKCLMKFNENIELFEIQKNQVEDFKKGLLQQMFV